MQNPFPAARYTGTRGPWMASSVPMARPIWAASGPGYCRHCGEASGACCCGCRECRREAKELLVQPAASQGQTPGQTSARTAGELDAMAKALLARLQPEAASAEASPAPAVGTATAFIGGGCCVSLSVEYAASVTTQPFIVLVDVTDSEGTAMLWLRQENVGTPYRVKEGVITTKPGATLRVIVLNATARVRWCEIFSCGC